MRGLVVTLIFLFAFAQSPLRLTIPDEITLHPGAFYALSSEGGAQPAAYRADWLPEQVILKGSWLLASTEALPGNYAIRIWAYDTAESTHIKIVVLHILESKQQSEGAGSNERNSSYTTTVTQINRTSRLQGNFSLIGDGENNNIGQGESQKQQEKNIDMEQQKNQSNPKEPKPLPTENKAYPDGSVLNDGMDVIGRYSTVTKREEIQYENNRYPEVDFPTAGNEQSEQLLIPPTTSVPQSIPPSRNSITYDDVALRAASERHQNAIKAITNLLSLITQARANLAQAQRNMEHFVYQYNEAIQNQRQTQNLIISIETKVQQISSALDSANVIATDLQAKLDFLEIQKNNLKEERRKIENSISTQGKTHIMLHAQLEKINAELDEEIKKLEGVEEQCEGKKNQQNNLESELIKLRTKFNQIEERQREAKASVLEKENQVEALRRELIAAEEQLVNEKILLVSIQDDKQSLPGLISSIEVKISSFQRQVQKCDQLVEQLQGKVEEMKSEDVENIVEQIQMIEGTVIESRKQLVQIDEKMALITEPKKDAEVKLADTLNDMRFLKEKLNEWNEKLRQAYIGGNEANTLVAHARESVEAANSRYQSETKILSDATLNLEKARSEEALAKLSLEELIALYSDALPYSIIPNGNGETDAGIPLGNNPSGSPLGPIKNDGEGVSGSFIVPDWTHYLSMAFGSGVHPSFPGSVTQLFPFTFYSSISEHSIHNSNYPCAQTGQPRAASGIITFVNQPDNSFLCTLSTGEQIQVQVEQCTDTTSNKPNYQMKFGDEVLIKAVQRQHRIWSASNLICLQ